MPIPRCNEPGDRGLINEILTGIEGSCRNARELLVDERTVRTSAMQPGIATPQNPNPPSAADLVAQAEGHFQNACAQMSRVIALAQALAAIGGPAPKREESEASKLNAAAGRMNGLHLTE